VTSPTLVVVSGPPGSGKTTLAHEIARALGCPAVCRDEIKEGMVHATPGFIPGPADALSLRTLTTFFDVLRVLLDAGVTVVAEAAFQDKLWRPGLEPLLDLGTIRVIRCVVDAAVAHTRIARRIEKNPLRTAHDDRGRLRALAAGESSANAFVPISLAVPTLRVDTAEGYHPALPDILAFINGPGDGKTDQQSVGDGDELGLVEQA
jgi:predicted kinase